MWQVILPSLVILTIASAAVYKKKPYVGRIFGTFQTWLNDEPFKEECENNATGSQSPLSTLNANRIGKGNPFYYLQYRRKKVCFQLQMQKCLHLRTLRSEYFLDPEYQL